ncbi:MAG: sugar transferase [Actinobacteria bacterium]|nr:sugar transferase [Actinomycetota bacterium]
MKAVLTAVDGVILVLAWLPVLLMGLDDRRATESLFVAATAVTMSLLIMRYEGLYLSRLCAIRSIEVRLIARSTIYTDLGLGLVDRMLFTHIGTVIRLKEVAIGAAAMLVLLVVERSVVRAVLRSARQGGARARDVLVVGSGAHAARLVSVIGDHPDYGMRVTGLVGDREAAQANGLGHLWLGTIDDTIEVALRTEVTGVVLSASAAEHPDITTMVKRLQRRDIHVQVSNGLAGFDVQRLRQLHLAHEPMIYLEASRPRRIDFVAKRAIDLSVSFLALLFLSPILIAASLAIKLTDRGPVLFKQERVGRNGRLFNVYKFRTMVVDAEQRKAELMAANERSGPLFKMDVDPRVTRIGTILRLTSLDEVPQLLNVLRGQMSIVGPRPALPSEVVDFDEELRRRELVKPGITGLWQVEARDSPSFDAYRRLDLFYVDNWTVVGDLEIMMDTGEHLLGRMIGQLRKRKRADVVPIAPPVPTEAAVRVREHQSTVA